MKRMTRDRYLTPAEAATYRAIREQIEKEKPELNARILSQAAETRGKDGVKSHDDSPSAGDDGTRCDGKGV